MSRHETLAAIGVIVWLFVSLTGRVELAASYLVMAAFVHVPLALRLLRPADESRRDWQMLNRAWPVAATALGLSALFDPGTAAGALASVWFGFTVLSAWFGLRRLLRRGFRDLPEFVIDAGLLMLPVGGVWTLAWRFGTDLLGFSGIWVLLTAVHFHYAAFLLPLVLGGFLRQVGSGGKGDLLLSAAVVSGIPLTAIGIATSQTVELIAAFLLAGAAFALAMRMFRRLRFALPAACLAAAMVLAAGYAVATTYGLAWLTIEQMVVFHGSANAIGFTLIALFVLVRLDPRPRREPDEMTFSRLRGDFRVGADFFERRGAVVDGAANGLVDRLEELNGPSFDAAEVAPEIVDFYENTADWNLDVTANWKWWFAPAGRLWHRIATRMEQTVFPVGATSDREVHSAIVALNGDVDGRPRPRAWVRTFADDGMAMYAAAYATVRHDSVGYMNIAFPMWRSNMASILVPENHAPPGASGLRLDTLTTAKTPDAGIWQVTDTDPVRLPLREYIDVWTSDDPSRPGDLDPRDASLVARHVLRAFGVHYLTLDYRMSPSGGPRVAEGTSFGKAG